MWIRLSVVWEDLIILSGCSRGKNQFGLRVFFPVSDFLYIQHQFVQTCQPHDYPCFQLLPIRRIQIQVWCGHIQGSQDSRRTNPKVAGRHNAGPVFAEHQMINLSYAINTFCVFLHTFSNFFRLEINHLRNRIFKFFYFSRVFTFHYAKEEKNPATRWRHFPKKLSINWSIK